MTLQLAMIDLDTGEIISRGYPILFKGRQPKPYSEWLMLNQLSLSKLWRDKEITGDMLRVLLFLIEHMDFENNIKVPQVLIASELNIHKQNISRYIKILESKEIITRICLSQRSFEYRLNPEYGWKGRTKNKPKPERQRKEKTKENN